MKSKMDFSDIKKNTDLKDNFSNLQVYRQMAEQELPKLLMESGSLNLKKTKVIIDDSITKIFPNLSKTDQSLVEFCSTIKENKVEENHPLRVGVVLSGGQAPGGHNVIAGVFDSIKKYHPNSQLFGFLEGPHGIYSGKYMELNDEYIHLYRNQGGFDMIRSGRHKIETNDQFEDSLKNCEHLKLDGLIIIGGDDSNTNACLLAEYFKKMNSGTTVIGVPKTIDGDLKNEFIEVSFGYDTATKIYSELIGNICIDTLSSKKYYHFLRLMGRSASHISLECALQCQVNYVLIGEEVSHKKQTLESITNDLFELILKRKKENKEYGIILVPEGLIEFVPEINILIKDINEIMAHFDKESVEDVEKYVLSKLSGANAILFSSLPKQISKQLLEDRDPHGNVQVSKIETEKLLILLLEEKVANYNLKAKSDEEKILFNPQSNFFGYEGRSALPSIFDSNYCYSLGFNCLNLILNKLSGYMSIIRNLKETDINNWIPCGCPLMTMMNVERRKGKETPVIKKALVDLNGPMLNYYNNVKEIWKYNDCYKTIGPIQFEKLHSFLIPYLVYTPPIESVNLNKFISSQETKDSPYSPKNEYNIFPLSKYLIKHKPKLPYYLDSKNVKLKTTNNFLNQPDELLKALEKTYPNLLSVQDPRDFTEIIKEESDLDYLENFEVKKLNSTKEKNLRIGVCFCGRQSPGGNNIINGLLEFQKSVSQTSVELIGFKFGTLGLFINDSFIINENNFMPFLNHGGYDFLGRSVDKIRTKEELDAAMETCVSMKLNGLVLIGSSHTLSDALLLSEYLLSKKVSTSVIGIPSTVDGNVAHPMLETTIGFDTASKVYSNLIGNILTDCASNIKYWYFIRLMGRSPSHLILECALQTHPNYVIISEDVADKKQNLEDIVNEICDIVIERSNNKKNYGTILIPEGLISYIPNFVNLINDLNVLFHKNNKDNIKNLNLELLTSKDFNDVNYLQKFLSPWSAGLFASLPAFLRRQLLNERESNGNIQLSQIETEKYLAYLVEIELKKRKKEGTYKGGFSPITSFFGYQGRCSFPSILDSHLATAHGYTAGVLIQNRQTGYCTTVRNLTFTVDEWNLGGIPLTSLCSLKESSTYGSSFAHISSSDVDLSSPAFLKLKELKKIWVYSEHYRNPGPIQYLNDVKNEINITLKLNHRNNKIQLEKIRNLCSRIRVLSSLGIKDDVLEIASKSLESVENMLTYIKKNTKK